MNMTCEKNNALRVTIEDDFDLEKIFSCGQCFRARRLLDGSFRFITGNNILYIANIRGNTYTISCDEETWNNTWIPYFSLETDYRAIRSKSMGLHPFIDQAIDEGYGLRILRQEPWEMLLTFIISQRKSIPAIATCVEQIAEQFGTEIVTPRERIMAFPSPKQMERATLQDLQGCSLGYRSRYVLDAISRVLSGELQLEKLHNLDDAQLVDALLRVKGVGLKVANCVGLFSYGRLSMVPVDVWIKRAISDQCAGCDPFPLYGDVAGVIQQYVFYYEKSHQK